MPGARLPSRGCRDWVGVAEVMVDPTPTAPVPTGLRHRFDPRPGFARVRSSGVAIVQIVVAATAAYAFSFSVLGHQGPLLTATVTISSLGLVRDARPARVAATLLGMVTGIAISELLRFGFGQGWWQLALALGMTLVVCRFLLAQPAFAIAAAIQSGIVMVIPANEPFTRLSDGVVGAVAALVVTALIPRSARGTEVGDGHRLFAATGSAAAAVVQGLRRGDRLRVERGLERARRIQQLVDSWAGSLDSALAIARISPFLGRQRSELTRHERIRQAMDLAIRNLRVVSRRAVYLTDDGQARPVAADVLSDLARGMGLIADSLDDIAHEPVAREYLRAVAQRLDPEQILPGAPLGEHNLIAAMRPLAVDLLVATGMPPVDARAAVPRV